MTTAQSPDDLQTLMAKDDLSDAEFARQRGYVTAGKIPAVFERISKLLAGI
jgi:hypothetical protein